MTRRQLEAIGVAVLLTTGGVIVAVGWALVEIGRAVTLPAGRVPDVIPAWMESE